MSASLSPTDALGNLPAGLRSELLTAFNSVIDNFRAERWEPSELNGGKLCEIVYTILRGHVDGSFPARAKKPRRFDQACRDLEQADPKLFSRSVRVHIPRVLIALYEVRNNRGVGHVGGDVDPNHMDAVWVVATAKWLLSELVRMFHDLTVSEAAEIVEALTERTIPIVWEVGNVRRVLDPSLSMKDKTLLLLYTLPRAATEQELVAWTEHSNASVFRRDVLRRAHKDKLIEFDAAGKLVHLSPTGARLVESQLPLGV